MGPLVHWGRVLKVCRRGITLCCGLPCVAQWPETGEAARKMNEALAKEKFRASQLQKRIFETTAKTYAGRGAVLHFEDNLEPAEVRLLADAIGQVCGGRAAVFSGNDTEGFAYAMVDHSQDLRPFGKEMITALCGRGDGKPNFQQGRVAATHGEIEAFFEKD